LEEGAPAGLKANGRIGRRVGRGRVWECGFWGFWGPAALSLVGSSIREVSRGWLARRLRTAHAKTKRTMLGEGRRR
jgi:hypothetical protein